MESRRTFLKRTAGAAALLAAGCYPIPPQNESSAKKKLLQRQDAKKTALLLWSGIAESEQDPFACANGEPSIQLESAAQAIRGRYDLSMEKCTSVIGMRESVITNAEQHGKLSFVCLAYHGSAKAIELNPKNNHSLTTTRLAQELDNISCYLADDCKVRLVACSTADPTVQGNLAQVASEVWKREVEGFTYAVKGSGLTQKLNLYANAQGLDLDEVLIFRESLPNGQHIVQYRPRMNRGTILDANQFYVTLNAQNKTTEVLPNEPIDWRVREGECKEIRRKDKTIAGAESVSTVRLPKNITQTDNETMQKIGFLIDNFKPAYLHDLLESGQSEFEISSPPLTATYKNGKQC